MIIKTEHLGRMGLLEESGFIVRLQVTVRNSYLKDNGLYSPVAMCANFRLAELGRPVSIMPH